MLPSSGAQQFLTIDLAAEPDFTLGLHRIAPSTREIVSTSGRRTVEPRVMQVLVRLASAEGAVVSRDDLIRCCWAGRIVSDDAVNRCIAKLRELANSLPDAPFAIETIPRVGYRLVASAGGSPCRGQTAGNAQPLSICVLPFENMSGDPAQEYFSDGISEDIITDLGKISAIRVVARNTAFRFRGRDADIMQVARELRASHILHGSVRKIGARVRVTAQLSEGETGNQIWAERYDRELGDIFALQDDISRAIVNALRVTLLPEEASAIERRGTDNAEAYELYLMARQEYSPSFASGPARLQAACRLCERATEIDPEYAQAWCFLAVAQYWLKSGFGQGGDGGEAAAERALALDSNLAEAHAIKARILFGKGCTDAANDEIEAALRLSPHSNEVLRQAGVLCYLQRRPREALQYYEQVAEQVPEILPSWRIQISCHTALGNTKAAQQLAKIALPHIEQALARDRNDIAALLYGSQALAVLGKRAAAKRWMKRALLLDPAHTLSLYISTCILSTYLGERDAALAMADSLFDVAPRGTLGFLKVDPDFDLLRRDPVFLRKLRDAEERSNAQKRIRRTA